MPGPEMRPRNRSPLARAEAEQVKVAAAELAGTLTALTAERDRLSADLAAAQTQIGRLTI